MIKLCLLLGREWAAFDQSDFEILTALCYKENYLNACQNAVVENIFFS